MLTPLLTILLSIIGIIIIIEISFYIKFCISFRNKKAITEDHQNVAISIILYAKDYRGNSLNYLESFATQRYQNFELIIVNHSVHEEDKWELEDAIKSFSQKYKNIPCRLVNILPSEPFWGNKKYALTLGVKATAYDHILFSDLKVTPGSAQWLTSLANQLSENSAIVLGYKSFQKRRKFENIFIRFHNFTVGSRLFSFAFNGLPLAGYDENTLVQKKLFFKQNGFQSHIKYKIGALPLFVNQISLKDKLAYQLDPNAAVRMDDTKALKDRFEYFKEQRAIFDRFKKGHQFVWKMVSFLRFLYYGIVFYLIFQPELWFFGMGLFFLRWMYLSIMFSSSAKKMKELDLLLFFPFFEIFHILLSIIVSVSLKIKKPTYW